MNKSLLLLGTVVFLLFSCEHSTKKTQELKVVPKKDSVKQVVDTGKNAIDKIIKTVPRNIQPVFGYRFVIEGDFDGDGKKEKLTEHYFSGLTNKETNKFYGNLPEYDQLVALAIKKEPYAFALSDNKAIDTLQISDMGQLLGLSYLKNEGDLNGDGTDEVSYVIDYADWSSLNSWHIVTYKNKQWQEIYKFDIWDWQLPDLPEAANQYGMFGVENKIVIANDTLNRRLEKELKAFKGLVKKIKPNKIQVTYRTEEADEGRKIVNLKRLK